VALAMGSLASAAKSWADNAYTLDGPLRVSISRLMPCALIVPLNLHP
jgi:hypothetical protein